MNLLQYFLMVSNARIYLILQNTVYNFVILFIFLSVKRSDMFLLDIQYGRV
jgi:hypothetical protein